MASECCICMEIIENVVAIKTQCNHLYHEECISEWFKKSSSCPSCRCRVRTVKESLCRIYIPRAEESYTVNAKIAKNVENATSERNTTEPWDLILNICDEIKDNINSAKDYVRSITERMGHKSPHVAIQAVTLLDACIKNCGLNFHLEIASGDFATEFERLVSKAPSVIAQKMCTSLEYWARNEFQNAPHLSGIPLLYNRMKSKAYWSTQRENTSRREKSDLAKALDSLSKELDSLCLVLASTSVDRTSPTTNFDRTIWIASLDKDFTADTLKFLILRYHGIGPQKLVIQSLVTKSVSFRKQTPYISFKIYVDNATTFDALLHSTELPKHVRVREFINRTNSRH